ncbi:MAG: hypothetical protein ACPG77_12835 [Nannocystaceae bacterium]
MIALSGLGKTTLAEQYPKEVLDADRFIYEAVADAFPDDEPRARLRAWRDLVGTCPWAVGGRPLDLWARTRRAMFEPLYDALRSDVYRVVVTSLLQPAWEVTAYYGIERGCYLEHLRRAGRKVDNRQSEAANARLEGFSPLVRLAPGTFVSDRPEIMRWVRGTA